jgi:hypothetical protein
MTGHQAPSGSSRLGAEAFTSPCSSRPVPPASDWIPYTVRDIVLTELIAYVVTLADGRQRWARS